MNNPWFLIIPYVPQIYWYKIRLLSKFHLKLVNKIPLRMLSLQHCISDMLVENLQTGHFINDKNIAYVDDFRVMYAYYLGSGKGYKWLAEYYAAQKNIPKFRELLMRHKKIFLKFQNFVLDNQILFSPNSYQIMPTILRHGNPQYIKKLIEKSPLFKLYATTDCMYSVQKPMLEYFYGISERPIQVCLRMLVSYSPAEIREFAITESRQIQICAAAIVDRNFDIFQQYFCKSYAAPIIEIFKQKYVDGSGLYTDVYGHLLMYLDEIDQYLDMLSHAFPFEKLFAHFPALRQKIKSPYWLKLYGA